MTPIKLEILRALASSKERMIPNSIGYALIAAGHITPRSPRPNAQGAALMVARPIAHLEKDKLIDYWDRQGESRGYAITAKGRAVIDQQANPAAAKETT